MAAILDLFDRTGNIAIRSADPENPTIQPLMKWIWWMTRRGNTETRTLLKTATNVHEENRVKRYRLNEHQLINERSKILHLHYGSMKVLSLFLSE